MATGQSERGHTVPRHRSRTDPREARARKLFREAGFDVESVSMIRGQHPGEFMAIKCWPSTDVATVVEWFLSPLNCTVHITRVHVGRETYPGSGKYHPRVFVAWDNIPEPRMSWEEIDKAVANLEHYN